MLVRVKVQVGYKTRGSKRVAAYEELGIQTPAFRKREQTLQQPPIWVCVTGSQEDPVVAEITISRWGDYSLTYSAFKPEFRLSYLFDKYTGYEACSKDEFLEHVHAAEQQAMERAAAFRAQSSEA